MTGADIDPDPETCETLREVADDIRAAGDGTEHEQVAALVHRVSDLYDEREETTPGDVYLNMRTILRVVESGGMKGDRERGKDVEE